MSETRGWAILTPRGAYVDGSAHRVRIDAWYAARLEVGCFDQAVMADEGYRAVRVRIVEE